MVQLSRLAKAKLATSLYDINRAMAGFTLIEFDFIPPGTRVGIDDYEGGIQNSEQPPLVDKEVLAAQPPAPPAAPMAAAQLSVPAPPNGPSQQQPPPSLSDAANFFRIKLPLPRVAWLIGRVIRGEGFKPSIPAKYLPTVEEQELGGSADNKRGDR